MSTSAPFCTPCDATWDWSAARVVCLVEARRVLGRTAAAEDAAQEALIRAWRGRASCATPWEPAPWLVTIARREALRIAARRCDPPLTLRLADPASTIEAHATHVRVDLQRALLDLSRDDRRLLAARYWEDLTQEQAARRLGLPEGTAKVRLHRLRERLREALSD